MNWGPPSSNRCNCDYYMGLKNTHSCDWYCSVHGTMSNWKQTIKIEIPSMKSAFDTQEGGGHYKDFPIQPIEFITKNNLNWFDGSIVKYACRHKNKGGALDLKKVIHYARLELEQEYNIRSQVTYSDEKEIKE